MNEINSTSFVSTPLSAHLDSMDGASLPVFAAQSTMQPVSASVVMDDMDHLYPEIYREVFPLVVDAVEKMLNEGYTPTPDSIGAIVDNIIRNSGLWYEDEDDNQRGYDGEAIPVQLGFGRSMPFQRRRRGHHNRNTLRDIIRILLLRELASRRHGFQNRFY